MKSKFLAMIVLIPAFGFSALAADNSWKDGTGNWETGGNWSLSNAPSITDTIDLITNAGNKTVTIDATTSSGFPATLSISNLTIAGVGGATNTLLVTGTGTNAPLNVLNRLQLLGGGALVIANGGQVFGTNATVGGLPATSNNLAVVTGPNSLWSLTGDLYIGSNTANSSLIVSNGGTVSVDGATVVGSDAGDTLNVSALVTGTNSVLESFAFLTISVDTPGLALKVADGAKFFCLGTAQIGRSAAAIGDIVLVTDPGTTWTNNTILQVSGFGGLSQFVVSNGATAYSGSSVIGPNPGITGNAATVTGPGSVWTVGGSITIGDAGGGTVTITNGGLVAAQDEFLAGSGGNGSVVVAGGTNLVFDQIQIGKTGGTGTVSVLSGALFVTNATASGTVQVNTNSTLILGAGVFQADNLIVTNGGVVEHVQTYQIDNANVTVADGGALQAGSNVVVASSDNSTGSVNVAGSLVATNGTTTVGGGSNTVASLTSSNGALNLAEAHVADGANSIGTVTLQAGSTSTIQNNLIAGAGPGSVATVNFNGGTHVISGILCAGNNGLLTGGSGFGQINVRSPVTVGAVRLGSSAGGHGILTVRSGGSVIVPPGFGNAAGFSLNDCYLDGGTIDAPSAPFFAGQTHPGELIVSNGVGTFVSGYVGKDDTGTLTMPGGVVNIVSNLTVGLSPGVTGVVAISGGQLIMTNGVLGVGNDGTAGSTGGVAHVTVSDGLVDAASILVGDTAGGDCSLTVAGTGYVRARGGLRSNGIKTTVVNGGTLEVVTGTPQPFEDAILHDRVVVSYLADGKLIVSNGTARTPGLLVGASPGNTGTLVLAGGTTSVFSNMTVGFVACTATGIVNVTGGNLYVTNTTGTAVLEVRSGTFTISSGLVMVDKLVVTSACARVVHTGGTLIYSQVVLDPNQSTVNDGIANGYKQQYNLDPFDPTLGGKDLDGTGFTVLQDYLSSFAPNNSAAYPHVISIAKTNTTDIKVIYLGANGDSTYTPGIASRTNVLEFTTGTANGSYATNNFASTGQTNILSGGTGLGVVTNMIDVGGATTVPSRYYRVRVLVP